MHVLKQYRIQCNSLTEVPRFRGNNRLFLKFKSSPPVADKPLRCVSFVVRKGFPYMLPLDKRVCTIHCRWPVRIFRTIRDPYRPFFSVFSPSTSNPPTVPRNGSLTPHTSSYAYRSSVALEFRACPVVCPPLRPGSPASAIIRRIFFGSVTPRYFYVFISRPTALYRNGRY